MGIPPGGGRSLGIYFSNMKAQAAKRGQELAAEVQHVIEQGSEAARAAQAEEHGTKLAQEAHQWGLDSAEKVKEMAKKGGQGSNKTPRPPGQRGQTGGGGHTGGGGQTGGGQVGGQYIPGNPPGTIPRHIPGVTPKAPPGPNMLEQTMKQTGEMLKDDMSKAQGFAQSQAGNAGAAASTTYTASMHLMRRPPPGIALNGYVVAVVVVVALIYLAYVFASAYSSVAEQNAKAREELRKAKEKALSNYSYGGPPPDFGQLYNRPRKAGG